MKRLLLVGAGHAHAQVLRDWAAAPLPGVALSIVSPQRQAPYSGMVPGWLSGRYRFDEICIDFALLARAAGAVFVPGEVGRLDAARRQVHLQGGQALDYDLLSLNIGSTLNAPAEDSGRRVLSLRPLNRLHDAWEELLSQWRADTAARRPDAGTPPYRITTVGGGAAGVEATLAVLARLRALQPARALQGRLLTRSPTLLPGMAPGAARAAQRTLERAGVTVQTGTDHDGRSAEATDLLLWAAGAEAHAWPRESDLRLSPRGFIAIDATLRSLSHPQVFAVGDCAEWAEPLPKAGVYAVRMGPVLSANLRAALAGVGSGAHAGRDEGRVPHAELARYRPQRRFLALLATGDGRAVASWGRWSAQGRWVWRWKDRIDRDFVRGFDPAATNLPAGAGGSSDRSPPD
jgi:pyridine nucleotide-disulfide oxidoreductase family protein